MVGTLAGRMIAVIKTDADPGADAELQRAVKEFDSAEFIIGVGACYAFNPSYQLGDVLVSNKITNISNQLENLGTRSIKGHIADIFCTNMRDGVRCGEFASCYKPVSNRELRDQIRSVVPEAIGGERAGGNLLGLGGKQVILIKGVAGYGNAAADYQDQCKAISAALSYIKTKLEEHGKRNDCGYLMVSYIAT